MSHCGDSGKREKKEVSATLEYCAKFDEFETDVENKRARYSPESSTTAADVDVDDMALMRKQYEQWLSSEAMVPTPPPVVLPASARHGEELPTPLKSLSCPLSDVPGRASGPQAPRPSPQ